MTVETWATLATTVLQGGGVSVFVSYLVRGLRRQVKSLEGTIDAQRGTIEAMDRCIKETASVGEIYKKLIREMPEDLENYKKIIRQTKDDAIAALQEANDLKEQQLRRAVAAKERRLVPTANTLKRYQTQ